MLPDFNSVCPPCIDEHKASLAKHVVSAEVEALVTPIPGVSEACPDDDIRISPPLIIRAYPGPLPVRMG